MLCVGYLAPPEVRIWSEARVPGMVCPDASVPDGIGIPDSRFDPCVFIRGDKVITNYVDDLLHVHLGSTSRVVSLKQSLKDGGYGHYSVGIRSEDPYLAGCAYLPSGGSFRG